MKEPKIKKRKLKYNDEKSTRDLLLLKDTLDKLPGVQRTDIDLLPHTPQLLSGEKGRQTQIIGQYCL